MEDVTAALMRHRHGVISRAQALDAGLTSGQVAHRVRSGAWVALGNGVYRHSIVRVTWHGRLLAGCLRHDALASHRSAAVLHGIDDYRPGRPEVVVAAGDWRAANDLLLHQSTQMDRADPTVRDAIPCTGLARTVLDLAAVVGRNRLEDTVDAVLRGPLDLADLTAVLARHSRRGRDGCGRLREVLDRRHPGERVPLSKWSRTVSRLLVENGLAAPELEHVIIDRNGEFIAQVDLAYPLKKVAIELDSATFHLNRRSFERDPIRRNRLVLAGWTVLTFTWRRIAQQPGSFVGEIRSAIATSPAI